MDTRFGSGGAAVVGAGNTPAGGVEGIYLGWRHAVLIEDPGPPPRRPTPPERLSLSEEWRREERSDESLTNRPLRLAAIALALCIPLWLLLAHARILPSVLAVVLVVVCLLLAVPLGVALWQGRTVARARLAEAEQRLAELQASNEQELRERQEQHAQAHAAWQRRRRAYEAQPRWYTVPVRRGASRVDVIGGTEAGWAAVLTTVAGSRLRAGGEVTIVDLSGRAVASDVVSLARSCGVTTRVWVLPADASRLNLGQDLEAHAFADVLVSVLRSQDPGRDAEADRRLLGPLVATVGTSLPAVAAGLRFLSALPQADSAQAAGPDVLTDSQRTALRGRFSTDHASAERAWELHTLLSALESLGSRAQDEGFEQVTVIATDRSSGEVSVGLFGGFALGALRHRARAASARQLGGGWRHTLLVCGAEHVSIAEREALAAAAEEGHLGVVLLHGAVGEADARLIRHGGSAIAVMRTEDDFSARVAEERLRGAVGGPAPLTPHPLTEIVGAALQDSVPDSYRPDSVAMDTGAYHAFVGTRTKTVAPLDYVRKLRQATVWGRTTHQAADLDAAGPAGASDGAIQMNASGFRALPPTALITAGAGGPVLVDANPGIMALPTATLATVEEGPPSLEGDGARSTSDAEANLGPPPERLDWRTGRT